jgi:hypothetical protein
VVHERPVEEIRLEAVGRHGPFGGEISLCVWEGYFYGHNGNKQCQENKTAVFGFLRSSEPQRGTTSPMSSQETPEKGGPTAHCEHIQLSDCVQTQFHENHEGKHSNQRR